RRRHTRLQGDWSSDVCSSDLREVPAIVDVETWNEAQRVLHANFILNPRGARRRYLLRGLIKCGICGLTYVGVAYHDGRDGERLRSEERRVGKECRSRWS